MNTRRVTAGAAVMALGALALTIWVFRHQIGHALAVGAAMWFLWRVAAHKLGLRRRGTRSRRTAAGVAAAGVGGYLLAHRSPVTHPCVKCGAPIGHPSRKMYCSPSCQNFARLERAKTDQDARALAAFGDLPEGF